MLDIRTVVLCCCITTEEDHRSVVEMKVKVPC